MGMACGKIALISISLVSLVMEYLCRPGSAGELAPSQARALFRGKSYYGTTSGFCMGYIQANIVVLPESLADDFQEFCKKNSGPLPLLCRSKEGEYTAPLLANDSDVR